jgi:hypothetical protein
MSVQITTAFTKQYEANCEQVAQQVETRARDKVMIKDMTGASRDYIDYVGTVSPVQRTTRHGDTTYTEIAHTRRQITTVPYALAELIDTPDKARVLIDPQNAYLQAFRAGFNRQIDSIIFAALRGTAYYGVDGASSVTLPSAQKVSSGSVGLTFEKLVSASEILNLADVPTEDEGGPNYTRWMAISPKQVSDLLKETEVGSNDYNLVKPLVEGKVTKFMGFNFVVSNLLTAASTTRYCLAWVKAGCALGMNYDVTSTVDRMPNKNNSIQVFMEMMLGASRLQESLVVEVACIES